MAHGPLLLGATAAGQGQPPHSHKRMPCQEQTLMVRWGMDTRVGNLALVFGGVGHETTSRGFPEVSVGECV